MNLTAIQLDIVWEDKAATFQRVEALLEAHPPEAGSLVVLPELFATGFSMNVAPLAEDGDPLDDPTAGFLAAQARRYGATFLGGLIARGPHGKGRNIALVITPDGRVAARYQKIHPFSFGTENQFFEPGRDVVLFPWAGFTVAPFICYDLRFPEVFRAAVRQGAQLFAVIANWPQPREAHWLTLLRARAIENQAYVIGVNRCGRDPNVPYSGRSQIIDPRGAILADAGSSECVITADIHLQPLLEYRTAFPALADTRYGLPSSTEG